MNLQQKTFCYEYLKDFNAVRAYKAVGYSHKNAQHNAYKMLKVPDVEAFVTLELGKLWDLSKDQWLQSLMDLKRDASKYSDKIRCLEIYGKSKNFVGADTTIQNYNVYSEALSKLKPINEAKTRVLP